jgi:type III secretion system (T3SS) SseB-like protein
VLPDNAALRTALAAGAAERVLEAILGGTLIVALTPDDGEPGTPLAVMRAGDGTLTALAFSGPGTLGMWGGTDRAAGGPGRAMAALIRDQGLTAAAIDIAGPVAAALDHADLRALASGVAEPGEPAPLERGRHTPLRLRAPHPPLDPKTVSALSAALRAHDVVDAAYVFEGPPEDGVRRLWLGLDIPPPREPAAVEDALRAGVDALREQLPDIRIEHTIVERDAVLASLRETAPPVYEAAR